MKQPKAFLFLSIIVAVLVLGIAYAAISNVSLQITGTAEAAPADSNFKVAFGKLDDGTYKPDFVATNEADDCEAVATFTVPADNQATITATGFKKVGDTLTATFYVLNNSTDLKASLPDEKLTVNGTTEYFQVTADLTNNEIAAKGNTTVTVTIKLLKLPISDKVTTTINVGFEAIPVNA